jgi:recombination protein RecT
MVSHGQRYSKTYKFGPWKDDFEKMGLKTMVKHILSKWAPLSTEMKEAIIFDQSVIKDDKPVYVDHNDDFSDIPDLPEETPEAKIVKENENTLFDGKGNVIDKPKK